MKTKIYRRSSGTVISINADAAVEFQENIKSQQQKTEFAVKVRENEDMAFGSIEFFLNDDPATRRRQRKFFL